MMRYNVVLAIGTVDVSTFNISKNVFYEKAMFITYAQAIHMKPHVGQPMKNESSQM